MNVCRKVLEKWLGPSDNWEEQFDSIDMTNKKGEDAVLFVVNDQLTYLMIGELSLVFVVIYCKIHLRVLALSKALLFCSFIKNKERPF